MTTPASPRQLLIESFHAAVGAADPLKIVAEHLPAPPKGRTLVIGAGKAAASMARATELAWPADAALSGLVVTRYGHGMSTERITVVEAGHPYPDAAGEQAARDILRAVQELGKHDRLIALISGGGSSLLSLPADGVTIDELRDVTKKLLNCGAPITDVNIVRKHLSKIQGGQLAAVCKAPITTLVISDVTGDDPSAIASGPTCPDPSTYQDALDILQRYAVALPASVQRHLDAGVRGEVAETPKPGAAAFAHADIKVIATAHQSLQAAAQFFSARGITPMVLGDTVTGEASEVAKVYAALAREVRVHGQPVRPPVALISGGECTVTVRGNGRGGRCAEFLTSLAVELDGQRATYALPPPTPRSHGTEDTPGAIQKPDTPARAQAKGVSAKPLLANNDGYGFFGALDDLLVTGPTRTNVNDFRVILIL
jgi:glycerate 2-kinase